MTVTKFNTSDRPRRRARVCGALLLAVALLVAVPAAAAPIGQLFQLAGTAGCVSETGAVAGGPCVNGRAMFDPDSVAVSGDGKNAYLATLNAVAVFQRNTTTGQLTQLAGTAGCVSETGSGGFCTDGKALSGARSVTVSADGKSVYVASSTSDAVAVFQRSTATGQLTQLSSTGGCVSETGSGGQCSDGRALDGASAVTVSPDGTNVYVTSDNSEAVASFVRSTGNGQLFPHIGRPGCIRENGSGGLCTDGKALTDPSSVAVTADGKHVYVASASSDAVAVFQRSTASGGVLTQLAGTAGCVSETGSGGQCADGKALDGALSLAVSTDGARLYVASATTDAVATFQRDATTGQLSQLAGTAGCISETGTGGLCVNGQALDGARSVAVSADGETVYAASEFSDAVTVFDATSGQLKQLAGAAGCVSETGNGGQCADGKALDIARSVAVSADGKHVYVTSFAGAAVAAFRRSSTGRLAQLAGMAGCVSQTGSSGQCVTGRALNFPRSVAISADGRSAYVASGGSDAVAVFARNTTTGQLNQLTGGGCVSETGSGGQCADGKALDNPISAAVSPDGNNVYVASAGSNAVAVFQRNTTTGALTQLAGTAGCVSQTGSGGACVDGKALAIPEAVAVSTDGRSVYVVSTDAVAVFLRDTTTGQLTQMVGTLGCVSETGSNGLCANGKALDGASAVAVSVDGTSLYVTADMSDAVAVFARNTASGRLTQLAGTAGCVSRSGSTGQCAVGRLLNAPESLAVTADGKSVYVASMVDHAVLAFQRNTTTGALTQLAGTAGCVTYLTNPQCARGRGLDHPRSVAVSADGENVYVASEFSDAVAAFERNKTTGQLTQLAGKAGCISETGSGGSCTDGKALDTALAVAVSADGKSVHVVSAPTSPPNGAVATFSRTP